MDDNNYITIVTSSTAANKIYDPDNIDQPKRQGAILNGQAETRRVDTLEEFKSILEKVGDAVDKVIILGFIP